MIVYFVLIFDWFNVFCFFIIIIGRLTFFKIESTSSQETTWPLTTSLLIRSIAIVYCSFRGSLFFPASYFYFQASLILINSTSLSRGSRVWRDVECLLTLFWSDSIVFFSSADKVNAPGIDHHLISTTQFENPILGSRSL